MKVKLDDGQIYIITREYSNFHMKTVDVENRITVDDAIRLRSELDAAINASQQDVEDERATTCPKCGSSRLSFVGVCMDCTGVSPVA